MAFEGHGIQLKDMKSVASQPPSRSHPIDIIPDSPIHTAIISRTHFLLLICCFRWLGMRCVHVEQLLMAGGASECAQSLTVRDMQKIHKILNSSQMTVCN